jgi:hypothetical protein
VKCRSQEQGIAEQFRIRTLFTSRPEKTLDRPTHIYTFLPLSST